MEGIPLLVPRIAAGFPSPAEDYLEEKLDLNQRFVSNPLSTFFVRVSGDSMRDACLHPDDYLIVDTSLSPRHNSIVIAFVNGDATVKRFRREQSGLWLRPENENYPSIKITDECDIEIWGVVTYVIKSLV